MVRFTFPACIVRFTFPGIFAWFVSRSPLAWFVSRSPASPRILVAHLAPFELRKGAKLVSQKKIVRGLRVIPPPSRLAALPVAKVRSHGTPTEWAAMPRQARRDCIGNFLADLAAGAAQAWASDPMPERKVVHGPYHRI